MDRVPREFTVSLSDNQHPIVTFEGDYINKRELDLCIRALKKKQREIIRNFRRAQIIADHEAKKGKVTVGNGTSETGEAGEGIEGATGKASGSGPAKEADAGSAGRDTSSSANSVSGSAGKVSVTTGAANTGK